MNRFCTPADNLAEADLIMVDWFFQIGGEECAYL